jgi:hypothetical protein
MTGVSASMEGALALRTRVGELVSERAEAARLRSGGGGKRLGGIVDLAWSVPLTSLLVVAALGPAVKPEVLIFGRYAFAGAARRDRDEEFS